VSDHANAWGALLLFDTDDAEFIRGFELGRTWALLDHVELPLSVTLHATNAEMALRIAEAKQVPVRSEELGDEWIEVVFGEGAEP
jgi:hypothetical protein